MKKVIVNCLYIVTVPVEIEVADNANVNTMLDKATDIAEDLLKEYECEFYDYEIEG